jgi:pseudaminic acid synthase
VVKDLKEGDELTTDNVRSIRPGFGMSPKYLKDIQGKRVTKNIKKGTPLTWDIIK